MRDVFYNENNRFAAAWLEGLIRGKQIHHGHVDRRSISDIRPSDVAGYRHAHFFAGIGGWPLALRMAGWPDKEPVWTGSCPCQPFSQAGRRRGVADERHLWPVWRPLIAELRPPTIFGEQVASEDGRLWFDGVRLDLEAMGYAVGCADLCAAGVGAPNIRQRLYWVAHSECDAREQRRFANEPKEGSGATSEGPYAQPGRRGMPCWMADAKLPKRWTKTKGRNDVVNGPDARGKETTGGRGVGRVARRVGDPDGWGLSERMQRDGDSSQDSADRDSCRADSDGSGPWDDSIWIPCADGKARRIEPGITPLAHGVPGRVGRLRGYGNAIVPPLAAEFVKAVMDVLGIPPENE